MHASPIATASTLNPLALLHAMKGEFDSAERLLGQAGAILRELGGLRSGVSHLEAYVRLLAGQPALAEAPLRADVETLSAMGDDDALATTTALLAQAVLRAGAHGRGTGAVPSSRAAARPRGTSSRRRSGAAWRRGSSPATAAARTPRRSRARRSGSLEPTDLLSHRGDGMLDLADVLRTCGRADEADRATRAALELYELKGNLAAAARGRSQLGDRPGGD